MAVNDTPNTAEIAERALEIIERRGWWQAGRGTRTSKGPVCVGQAIALATDFTADFEGAMETVARLAGVKEDKYGVAVIPWNDDPERTVEDVMLVLKRMAAGERAS